MEKKSDLDRHPLPEVLWTRPMTDREIAELPNPIIDEMLSCAEPMAEPLAGHPGFHALCDDMKALHAKKNHDYANGGGPFGNFERMAALIALYPGLRLDTREGLALSWMLKQFDAYLFMKSQGHESKTGEGLRERLKDIAVYTGILHTMEGEHEAGTQGQI